MDYSAIAIFGAGVGIVAWRLYQLSQTQVVEKKLAETGVPLVGVLVQANTGLFEPGPDDLPAQILISFPGPNQATTEELTELAGRIFVMKDGPLDTPLEKRIARLVRNEAFVPGRRDKLPPDFTGGKEVYSVGLWVRRKLLPGGRLTQRVLPVAANPGDSGIVALRVQRQDKLPDV